MITPAQIRDNFSCISKDNSEFFFGSWEYEFRINGQTLWCINDGFGEPEFIGKFTDIDELKNAFELLNENFEKYN